MKTDKFKNNDDNCELCNVHTTFNKEIDYIPCPSCNNPLQEALMDLQVVGDNNGDTKNITKCPVTLCGNCDEYIALLPVEITYNANHDIHYTGQPSYLTREEDKTIKEEVVKRLEAKIKHFVERVKAGENRLNDWNLRTWMECDIQEVIGEFLWKHGYKKGI